MSVTRRPRSVTATVVFLLMLGVHALATNDVMDAAALDDAMDTNDMDDISVNDSAFEMLRLLSLLDDPVDPLGCRRGQMYTDCKDECQPTCNSLTPCAGRTVSATCDEGCVCPLGLVYSPKSNGRKCIPQSHCSKICNKMNRRPCDAHPGCKWSYKFGVCFPPLRVRVRPDKIPCPANQVFRKCGSMCPPQCDDDPDVPRPCIQSCYRGCQCKQDEFLDPDTGYCYKNAECDSRRWSDSIGRVSQRDDDGRPLNNCKQDTVYSSCGSACEPKCDDPDDEEKVCITGCQTGCFCPPEKPIRGKGDKCYRTKDECPGNNS